MLKPRPGLAVMSPVDGDGWVPSMVAMAFVLLAGLPAPHEVAGQKALGSRNAFHANWQSHLDPSSLLPTMWRAASSFLLRRVPANRWVDRRMSLPGCESHPCLNGAMPWPLLKWALAPGRWECLRLEPSSMLWWQRHCDELVPFRQHVRRAY